MTEYYHTDALGSVFALTNASGVTTASYTYDPFGNTTQTGVSSNPFQYTGREQDGTGLLYYRARYYSPSLQRFISEDPIQLVGGINFYRYAENNPLLFKDPLGLDPKDSKNCELTTSGVRVRIPCPEGDPTQVPPEIIPDPLPTNCKLDCQCLSSCIAEKMPAFNTVCASCSKIRDPRGRAACLLGCAGTVATAITSACTYKCTSCN
ncbi:MAG: hypothetical protein HY089_09790 [Ignavibacteriales bacterium]|nr:hypothetical protein [Ignavibacteriales bacterium]